MHGATVRFIISDKIYEGNQNAHFMFNESFFFLNSYCLSGNMERYDRARQATDDNMAHAHCMLDN